MDSLGNVWAVGIVVDDRPNHVVWKWNFEEEENSLDSRLRGVKRIA
jgi:hypothetical protein